MPISINPSIIAKTQILSELALYKRIRRNFYKLRDLEQGKNGLSNETTLSHYAHQISLMFTDAKEKKTELNYHTSLERLRELYKELKKREQENPSQVHIKFHGNSFRYHVTAPKHLLNEKEHAYIYEFHLLTKMETWLSHHVHDFCILAQEHFDALYNVSINLLLLIYKTRTQILDTIEIIKSKKELTGNRQELYKKLKEHVEECGKIVEENRKSYKAQVDSKVWKFIFTPAKKEILNFRSQKAKLFFEKVHAKNSIKKTRDIKKLIQEFKKEKDPPKLEKQLRAILALIEMKLELLTKAAENIKSYTLAIEKETHKVKHYASHVTIEPRHVEHIKASVAHLNSHVHKEFLSLEDLARLIMNYYQRDLARRIA